jgi:hypothetical protein
MKTIATLALIVALLGLPAVNATADTFTLWEYFPQTINLFPYGFGTAGVATNPLDTLMTPLVNTAPYSFSWDGAGALPIVKRSATYPLIFLQPSGSETAVYYGIPTETDSLHVTGDFTLVGTAILTHVDVGTADITNPDYPVFTSLTGGGII